MPPPPLPPQAPPPSVISTGSNAQQQQQPRYQQELLPNGGGPTYQYQAPPPLPPAALKRPPLPPVVSSGHQRRPLPAHFRLAGASNYEDLRRPDSHSVATAMGLQEASPRQALQRILVLYERGEHREAAAFMRRLSFNTFRAMLPQLPADVFVESMPHSLPILEALYAKLFMAAGNRPCFSQELLGGRAESLRPEAVVWQLVKFFAGQDDGRRLAAGQMRWEFCGPFISSCKRLLSVLLAAEPRLRRLVAERRRTLTKAVEGLGKHGLVGTSDEQLMNLHAALKLEFEKAQKTYTEGIQQLEALSLLRDNRSGKSNAPVAQSHQRQLSLKSTEIQERLIKNKTLLNVVEPTLENTSLEVLLGILQQRIELDKECLFQYTQIRKDLTKKSPLQPQPQTPQSAAKQQQQQQQQHTKDEGESVAPIFMRYQKGCQQVGKQSCHGFHNQLLSCRAIMMFH